MYKRILFALLLSFVLTPVAGTSSKADVPPALAGVQVRDFQLVSPGQGWLLSKAGLYWTRNSGQNWDLITPGGVTSESIQSVFFLDVQHGWLVFLTGERTPRYALAQTANGGRTWQTRALELFASNDVNAYAPVMYVHWTDTQNGWIMARAATGSNFAVGTLFRTTDAGNSWTRLAVPTAGPVYFRDAQNGWIAGGPARDQLYRTVDGGRTWVRSSVAADHPGLTYQTPRLTTGGAGILPVLLGNGNSTRYRLYRSRDGGATWAVDGELPFKPEIQKLDLLPSGQGWAMHVSGKCEPNGAAGNGARRCTTSKSLLRTEDAGRTWQDLPFPAVTASAPDSQTQLAQPSVSSESTAWAHTQILSGQGFDKCDVADLASLEDWRLNSPYDAVNLYIGGSSRACANAALTADYVAHITEQGWKLIPTWVGPQAACTGFSSRMINDPIAAYNQGIGEANAALSAAQALGLTDASQTGTVIYYDLEGYDVTDSACRDAANAFISGWSGQMQARGNAAGAYGAAYGTAVSDWLALSHVPDALWLAHWWLPYQYRSDATVWDPAYVPNTGWPNHQRIRQYAGGHDETWGGTTLNIDSSVTDGIVATGLSPVTTQVTSVWTTDGTGAPKSTFDPNDAIRYSATISNTSGMTQNIYLGLSVTGGCGPIASWSGMWSAPAGNSTWTFPTQIPTAVCEDTYTFRLFATYDSVTTSKSVPLVVHGTTFHMFLPFGAK